MSSFSQTLNSITTTKLQVLSRQHSEFTSHREKTLSSVKATKDPRERVQILLDGVKSWRTADTTSTESSSTDSSRSAYLENIERFLLQSQNDPSIGQACLHEWETKLTQSLETEKVKFEYAELFGRLLNEWIASSTPMEKTVKKMKLQTFAEGSGEEMDIESPSSDDAFEKVGRKEMHEQRSIFESHVFTAKETDTAAIGAYLEELFSSSKEGKAQLVSIRKHMDDFGGELLYRTTFTVHDLKSTIASLLASGLLSNEKRNTLKEFVQNKTILTEVADVLNMHLSTIPSWSWTSDGTDAIPIEMRRQLNGKYRIFMDEEILQALFLHYIGLKWAVEFKKVFKLVFASGAWKLPAKPLSKDDNERREYFLSELPSNFSTDNLNCPRTIHETRRLRQRDTFFMNQLPENLGTRAVGYSEDDSEGSDDDDSGDDDYDLMTPTQIKQSLLHIVTTECLLNTVLHNRFTVVRSDFSWFGPSLPHTSIITALRFLGVSETWLTFFQKFLSAPLRFVADGPLAPIQTRKCGVPISHSLSDLFGEVLLFCMDYAVNQRADGLFLYRIHDDFWFWDSDPTICVKAWKEMSTFSHLVGLEFNYEKTGSVSVGQQLHPDLPTGSIMWGFLKFEESGQFVIDQSQVDVHIAELRLQLAACNHSVFAWVQAYNKYVSSFFVNNFGSPPAQCFGKRHADMVISTLQRIHLELFPKHHGSVTEYLADVIQERFGVRDIPTGWYYWPVGGLEVKSPFINQYAIRDSLCTDPLGEFRAALEKEKEKYEELKEEWNSGTRKNRYNSIHDSKWEPFFSYEEFTLHRERRLQGWKVPYDRLLMGPDNCAIRLTAELGAELNKLSAEMGVLTGRGGISRNGWGSMSVYWQWIVACYGEGMAKKWGGLEIVRPGSLPVGMVDVWKSRKLKWEQ